MSMDEPRPGEGLARRDRVILALLGALLAVHLVVQLYHVMSGLPPTARVRWTLVVPIWCTFILAHALYSLGWHRTGWLVGITVAVSFGFEYVGVRTGWPFGAYYYTDALGPKIAGTVPAVIPFAYLMMLYPSHVITNLILDGRPVSAARGWPRMVGAGLLTAMVMTAWDLTTDPVMVGTIRAWVWVDGGPYFGIPFSNFAGWVLVVWVVCVAYRLVEARVPAAPLGSPRRWIALGPLIGYGALALCDTAVATPEATRILPAFAMGVPLLAASLRLADAPLDAPHALDASADEGHRRA
jgi:uncharacterized membrane protein